MPGLNPTTSESKTPAVFEADDQEFGNDERERARESTTPLDRESDTKANADRGAPVREAFYFFATRTLRGVFLEGLARL